MNYDEARQRQEDGRWDWTTGNRRTGTRAAGYCAGWTAWTEARAALVGFTLAQVLEEQARHDGPTRAKFHTDGHATREEAERCYYTYCLDRLVEGGNPNLQHRCEAILDDAGHCNAWTSTCLTSVGLESVFAHHYLCDAHRTTDAVAKISPFRPGMQIMHS